MADQDSAVCVPIDISDKDIYAAMKDIPGYLDITPGDFKELYLRAYNHAVLRLTRSVAVAEVMTKDVGCVTADTGLAEVAEVMAARKVSGVPVIDGENRVVGIVSEKDLLAVMGEGEPATFMEVIVHCLKGRSCLAVPVRAKSAADIMSSPAITVGEHATVTEAAELMSRKGINRVPVVDGAGRMVGIVSRGDVVRTSFFGGPA